jgi:hypothetical protein
MRYVISRHERTRGQIEAVPVQDMVSFSTRQEAEARLGSFAFFSTALGPADAGFHLRELPDGPMPDAQTDGKSRTADSTVIL